MSISSLIKVRLENEIIDVDRQTKLKMGGGGGRKKKGRSLSFSVNLFGLYEMGSTWLEPHRSITYRHLTPSNLTCNCEIEKRAEGEKRGREWKIYSNTLRKQKSRWRLIFLLSFIWRNNQKQKSKVAIFTLSLSLLLFIFRLELRPSTKGLAWPINLFSRSPDKS